MKKIAYIGLSSPLCYDYKYQANRSMSSKFSNPNPIIESSFGIMILYDEIWFLSESLCPNNLRGKYFIKYLENSKNFGTKLLKAYEQSKGITPKDEIEINLSRKYNDVIKEAGIYWDAQIDNHTHSLKISNKLMNGNSLNGFNYIFDSLLVKILNEDENVDYISNSVINMALDKKEKSSIKINLTEGIMVGNIPNFLTKDGPYHSCVEEIRENKYIKEFREYIDSKDIDEKDVLGLVDNVNEELRKYRSGILRRAFKEEDEGLFYTIAKIWMKPLVDVIVPFLLTPLETVNAVETFRDMKKTRWCRFLFEADMTLKNEMNKIQNR